MFGKKKEEDKKLALLEESLKDISKYQEKPTSEFFDFVKKFFAEFLELTYEVTYQELTSEIESTNQPEDVQEKVKKMAEQFLEFRYHQDVMQEVPGDIIESFRDVLKALKYNHIINKQKEEKKKNSAHLHQKILSVIEKYAIIAVSVLLKVLLFPFLMIVKVVKKVFRGKGERLEEELAGIKLKVDEVYELFESKDYDKVKTKYQDLLKTYESLSVRQKERMYDVLKDLHDRLTASSPQENRLAELIEEAHFLFENKDYTRTKDKYLKVFELYNSLSKQKKENFYDKIIQLHNKLTKA